jgi:NAD(P)-dependent dehydrogenase (short-subunit alcohol dehydrogenase family)
MNEAKRIVLITGATRGLGLETARQLARSGHAVVLAGRDGAVARTLGDSAMPLELDVRRPASIAQAVKSLRERYGRLDVLVNNAGVMLDGSWVGNTAASIDDGLLRDTFETNLFAVVRVTQALLPLLRLGREPHIVNVSSVMGSLAIHADPTGPLSQSKPFAYDASKTALNAFTVHLASALAADGIRVNSVHPGWVRTALGTDAATLDVAEGARPIVDLAARRGSFPTGRFLQQGGELPW